MEALRSAPLPLPLASVDHQGDGVADGERLRLPSLRVDGLTREVCAELLGRAVIGGLFTLLSFNLLADFMRTGRLTGLLLVASESLVVVMTIARRRARLVDRSISTAIVTSLALVAPFLLRASATAPLLPDGVTTMMSAIGLALVVTGKVALGRSFGVAPANRGVVVRGPYTIVRHPIYAAYLITHLAFLIANPSPWNVAVIVVADTALIVRALLEERVLSGDVEYQRYCLQVGWHLMPGVF
jgi:protein-S-isoprenylcysteine O-methyltransferase Ste14